MGAPAPLSVSPRSRIGLSARWRDAPAASSHNSRSIAGTGSASVVSFVQGDQMIRGAPSREAAMPARCGRIDPTLRVDHLD